jgi:KDO transferase-3
MTSVEALVATKSFAELRGTCRGDLFIIASGPSAQVFPLQRYAHLPMPALNDSICA